MCKVVKSAAHLSLIAVFVVLILLTGCARKDSTEMNGPITIIGSTALQPLVEEAANRYIEANPTAKILVQGGGSGTGLTQVAQGGADIGNSDLFAEERLGGEAKTLVDHKVAVAGIAVVANKAVTVHDLTRQQLIDLFTGKVANWKQVGGPDVAVVIVNRPKSSGTLATFRKYALGGAEEASGKALTEDSSGAVRKTIAETKGAIGYMAMAYVDKSVSTLSIDGVAPTKDNIATGKYPVWSYEHMYTKGEPTGLEKAFLEYMLTDDVQQKIVPLLGYIPITDMKVSR